MSVRLSRLVEYGLTSRTLMKRGDEQKEMDGRRNNDAYDCGAVPAQEWVKWVWWTHPPPVLAERKVSM